MGAIFISYAREQSEHAEKLKNRLNETDIYKGWTDTTKIKGGEEWREAIRKALKECEAMIVIASTAANNSSWVNFEIAYALILGKFILPVKIYKEDAELLLLQDIMHVSITDETEIFARLDENHRQTLIKKFWGWIYRLIILVIVLYCILSAVTFTGLLAGEIYREITKDTSPATCSANTLDTCVSITGLNIDMGDLTPDNNPDHSVFLNGKPLTIIAGTRLNILSMFYSLSEANSEVIDDSCGFNIYAYAKAYPVINGEPYPEELAQYTPGSAPPPDGPIQPFVAIENGELSVLGGELYWEVDSGWEQIALQVICGSQNTREQVVGQIVIELDVIVD